MPQQTTMPLNLYRLQMISLQHLHKQTTLVHQNPVPPDAPQGENSSQPLSSQSEIHPPDALTGEDTQPTASQTSDNNIGYVEQLLTYKYINGKKYFQVKWIGHSERTW